LPYKYHSTPTAKEEDERRKKKKKADERERGGERRWVETGKGLREK
jgi:hypothetical protein